LTLPDWLPPEYYLLTNEDMRKAADNTILGVVRAIERSGQLLRDDIAHRPVSLASIDPNAATTTASATAASVTVPNSNFGTLTNIASVSVGPFPVPATVVLTVSGSWSHTSASGGAADWGLGLTSTGFGIAQTSASYSGSASGVMGLSARHRQSLAVRRPDRQAKAASDS
jgi:hypothetical protein